MPGRDFVLKKITELTKSYNSDLTIPPKKQNPLFNPELHFSLDEIQSILDEVRAATSIDQLKKSISKLYIVVHNLYYNLTPNTGEIIGKTNTAEKEYSAAEVCNAKIS